jgi:hypothetical protein
MPSLYVSEAPTMFLRTCGLRQNVQTRIKSSWRDCLKVWSYVFAHLSTPAECKSNISFLCVCIEEGDRVCVCVCLWCEGCFPFCYRPSVNKGTCGWVRYQSGHSEGICIINYHSWTGGQSDLPSHLYRVPDDEHPGLGAWDTAVPCTGIQRLPGQDVWPAYIDHGGETVSDLTPAWAICMACRRWIYRLPGQNEWPAYGDHAGEDC